jgi:hypothetical protein
VPYEVATFGVGEEIQGRRDQLTNLVKGPWAGGAEERLQLGEGQFDRIQVGTVRREEPELGPDGGEGGADRGMFVDREIIEDDDVSRAQRRHQDLLDVGEERRMVDRSIEHGRGAESVASERGHDGVCLPTATRRVIAETRAAGTPAIAA